MVLRIDPVFGGKEVEHCQSNRGCLRLGPLPPQQGSLEKKGQVDEVNTPESPDQGPSSGWCHFSGYTFRSCDSPASHHASHSFSPLQNKLRLKNVSSSPLMPPCCLSSAFSSFV